MEALLIAIPQPANKFSEGRLRCPYQVSRTGVPQFQGYPLCRAVRFRHSCHDTVASLYCKLKSSLNHPNRSQVPGRPSEKFPTAPATDLLDNSNTVIATILASRSRLSLISSIVAEKATGGFQSTDLRHFTSLSLARFSARRLIKSCLASQRPHTVVQSIYSSHNAQV